MPDYLPMDVAFTDFLSQHPKQKNAVRLVKYSSTQTANGAKPIYSRRMTFQSTSDLANISTFA